ncbi:MAG: hypothetical protein JSV91_04310 [Phycisphaerales bacterium]|nr:MAG: hypothetical protein JSV91_04310 [Phycisphaerales bacterium]
MDLNPESLLLIVVGAHLQAEANDRPLANRLRDRIVQWQDTNGCAEDGITPYVCCDLWYLNTTDLMERPTIAIGDPEFNAATAYLANRLPTALVVDESLRVQLDPEFIELNACVWGVNPTATAGGVDLFVDRYLDGFLRSVHHLPPAAH